MEELPYDTLVSLLARLPRPSLLNVAQVSRTLLEAASDERIWVPTDDHVGAGLLEPEGLRGISGSSARGCGMIRTTVIRWVAHLLRMPWQSLVPLSRLELTGSSSSSRFHVKISLHPIKTHLASSEVLVSAAARALDPQPRRPTNTDGVDPIGVRDSAPEDAWLMGVGLEGWGRSPSETLAAAAAAVGRESAVADDAQSAASLLADLLRAEMDRARREESDGGEMRSFPSPPFGRRWERVARGVECVRAERGAIRLRLAPSLLVAAALLPFKAGDVSPDLPPEALAFLWSREVPSPSSPSPPTSDSVLLRPPVPPTPWSCLRAHLVGAALQTMHSTRGEGTGGAGEGLSCWSYPRFGWGVAVRIVMEAADHGRAGAPARVMDSNRTQGTWVENNLTGSHSISTSFASLAITDARAGNAWPALLRELRGDACGGSTAVNPDGMTVGKRVSESRGRLCGLAVGGCKSPESIAAAVTMAGSWGKEGDDDDGDALFEGAAAVGLALLSYAPRAHECVLDPPHRWHRTLSNAVNALRQFCAISKLLLQSESAGSKFKWDDLDEMGWFRLEQVDAEHAMWLEESNAKLQEACKECEPREVAAGVLGLAAAAAAVLKKHTADYQAYASRGLTTSHLNRTREEAVRNVEVVKFVRHEMLRRTHGIILQSLRSLGILSIWEKSED